MDSSKDSELRKSTVKFGGGGDKDINKSNVLSPSGVRDNAESIFTTANSTSSFVPLNGPGPVHMNPSSGNEHTQRAGRSSESASDTNKYLNNSTQSHMCNKVPDTAADQAECAASTSGSIPNSHNNGTDNNQDVQSCQRHKVCIDNKTGSNVPSTSGTNRASDNPESSGFRESRKRPSSLKLNRPSLDDDSSSDTGNDDYSLESEDGCIYTYRGGEHLADLPSSFFSLDMGLPLDKHLPIPNYPVPQGGAPIRDQASRASSPDMDFLEMDFDPGPSCEVDTGDESSPDIELDAAINMPEEKEPVLRPPTPEYVPIARHSTVNVPASTSSVSHVESDNHTYSVPSTSRGVITSHGEAVESHRSYSYGPYITHVNTRGEQLLVRRTMAHGPANVLAGLHLSSGDVVSPREFLHYEEEHAEGPFAYQINQGERPSTDSVNFSSAFYHLSMVKKLMADKNKSDFEAQSAAKPGEACAGASAAAGGSTSGAGCVEPPRCMIWSECEACERQVTQIGTSACGATAVVNVFIALGVPVNLEKINSSVGTRQRANNAPLPRYLLSRAVAGCTAADLVTGIHRASDGLVTARFFPTYPERAVSLSHWLADWITVGAVPILTLNLQVGFEAEVPDAWHHQMVFGVDARGVYLCNPAQCVREAALWPRLTSPSVLLVRTRDILARFNANTDLTPLMAVPDRRFHTFNVLGQVANVFREWRAIGWGEYGTRTRHIRIPASYQAGITVSALTGSEAHKRLMSAPQLPVLTHTDPA